jgi:hypothetical protein
MAQSAARFVPAIADRFSRGPYDWPPITHRRAPHRFCCELRRIAASRPCRSCRAGWSRGRQRRCRSGWTAGPAGLARPAWTCRPVIADARHSDELRGADVQRVVQCRRGPGRRVLRPGPPCTNGNEREFRLLRHRPERCREPVGGRLRAGIAIGTQAAVLTA